ncbi:MAG: tetratricopeptide repeat protein [Deltaproteobacteria bacterium]|nr:tetratricopeptide repeat protein [Deltaproteobacteria bacterium]
MKSLPLPSLVTARLRDAMRRLGLLLLISLVPLTACRGAAPMPPLDPADPQALEKHLVDRLAADPEDTAARRDLAHLRWIHLGQTDAAIPDLDRLAQSGDPLARVSRMIIARSRGELDVLQEQAFNALRAGATATSDDASYRLVTAVARHAAQVVGDQHGDREGDDERFVQLYEALDISALPFEVAQPLMSLRAAIARRQGEAYRPYYRSQGCVQQWAAGPMIGSRGAVELSHTSTEPLVNPEQAWTVVPLACVVRVWNPSPSPGVRRLETFIEAPGGPVLLNLGAAEATRFYLDGQVLHRNDGIDRHAPVRSTLRVELAAGWHRIQVHTTVPSERAWVMLRALDASGTPLHVDASPPGSLATAWSGRPARVRGPWPDAVPGVEGPLYAPLRDYLAVDEALTQGNADLAERQVAQLDRAKQFAQGYFVRARFERADPSRGRTVSVSREVEALERSLELDPAQDAVHLRLLALRRDRGEEAEVSRELQELPADRLAGVDGQLLRFSVFLAQGNEHRAEQALAQATALSPRSCKVLMAGRTLALDRADVREEDRIAAELSVCAGSLGLRARLAETRGRWDDAQALWSQVLERVPDDLSAHENLARVEALRGKLTAARTHLRQSLRFNPFRVGSHLALADLAATEGDLDAARTELKTALQRMPQSNVLWRAAADLGIEDDLMRWRTDGSKTLADYRASGTAYEGVGEVLVLDRSVARVYDNGGQRQIVHIIAHLLSKEALDEYGELDIPEGASLLTLRTIKPDGRTLEPEVVPGKDGVSLRHLEVDDVVEYEFVVERGPAGAVPGYVDVSTFRFQSADVPYHRSELLVVHSPAMPLLTDRRNDPPEDVTSTAEVDGQSLTVHHWRAQQVPRLGVEPGARNWLEELPSVHVYTALDLPRYLDGLASQIRDTQRRNPQLRRLARRLTRGHATEREQLRALWVWVVENIEDGGDLSVPASATLAARTGNRLMLLRAMLREVGIDAQLWLARDGYGPAPLPGGHPLIDAYEAAMLAVKLPDAKERLMVMTASKVMPLGYLAPGYRETAALRIGLEPHEGKSGPVSLPVAPAGLDDTRAFDLEYGLDAQGAGTVQGTITLQGMEAILWRQALRQIDRDRIEEVFQQAELGWLPGGTLSELSIDNEESLEQPLVLRFSARTSGVGVVQDGDLVMRATPLPLNPGAPYAALPTRTTGLVLPYAPQLTARLRYALAGAKFADIPPPRVIESAFGSFEREIVEGQPGGARLELRVRSSVVTGVVEATRYQGLADFARQVDTAMQDLVRAR